MKSLINIPKVKDILNKNVIALLEDYSTLDAIKCFNEYRISTAPVLNAKDEVVGYLSESDCIKYISHCLFYDELGHHPISHIMSKNIATVSLTWDVFELETFFIKNHLRNAPVLDCRGHLVGLVTRSDILTSLEKCFQQRIDYKEGIKNPIELNTQDRVVMIMNSRDQFGLR